MPRSFLVKKSNDEDESTCDEGDGGGLANEVVEDARSQKSGVTPTKATTLLAGRHSNCGSVAAESSGMTDLVNGYHRRDVQTPPAIRLLPSTGQHTEIYM